MMLTIPASGTEKRSFSINDFGQDVTMSDVLGNDSAIPQVWCGQCVFLLETRLH